MKRLAEPEIAGPVPAESTATKLRRSPLTDPRALVVSLVIHALLLVVASLLVLKVSSPAVDSPGGRVMEGELDATDNRAMGEPGGISGEPEGRASDLSAEAAVPAPPSKDAAADALLSEILPTRELAETPSQTLPGPSTSGLGMLRAAGTGEGAGATGSSSGGGGKGGTGPGTEFFGARDEGRSFAYVIDCSGSMLDRGSLTVAKGELLRSLDKLPAEARFAVVFYNLEVKVFADPAGNSGLMAATPENKTRLRNFLATVPPYGLTDHMLALRTAFALHPEVIFFLTDAQMMNRQEVAELVAEAGKTRIQAIEFGQITGAGGSAPLKKLAKLTGGTYQYIDVNTFRH